MNVLTPCKPFKIIFYGLAPVNRNNVSAQMKVSIGLNIEIGQIYWKVLLF